MKNTKRSDFKRIVHVFQGGGALGAYQAGVFNALVDHDYEPDWVIGTSIGAINASIIAGNPPARRQEKLYEFWDAITQDHIPGFVNGNAPLRRFYNFLSAQQAIVFGNDHFFLPRIDNPLFASDSTPDQISFYSTEPLKKLLLNLIDFDFINQRNVRLTLCAVEIEHGKAVHFDNHKNEITIDHILASGALPPGFPAIKINEKYYWDGGVLTNAPIGALLYEVNRQKTLCFVTHLFDSFGLLPNNLDDVLKRHKDITYSSHFKSHMETFRLIHGLRYIISQLSKHLPDSVKNEKTFKQIIHLHEKTCPIHFVRFLYEAPVYELSSKDYEFSKLSMHERCQAGYDDACQAIEKSPWLDSNQEELGISIHEFYRDLEKLKLIQKTL